MVADPKLHHFRRMTATKAAAKISVAQALLPVRC